jgi:endonuclease YncB( thermonuclease family)
MYNLKIIVFSFVFMIWAAGLSPASAADTRYPPPEVMAGPIAAELLHVIDGDSIKVKIRIWLDQDIVTTVRVRGIDAPEIKGKCDWEKEHAQMAKARMEDLTKNNEIILTDIQRDKYGGRVIADVATPGVANVSSVMIHENLARPYFGKKRAGWCEKHLAAAE